MIKNDEKFKISAWKKLKSGKILKRFSSSPVKMKNWISAYPFESIIINCRWGWGENKATYLTNKEALFFINENYKDYIK